MGVGTFSPLGGEDRLIGETHHHRLWISSRVFHMVPCAMQAAAAEVGPTSTRSLVVCCLLLLSVCCCLLVLCACFVVVERPPQKKCVVFLGCSCCFLWYPKKIQRTTKALRFCRRYEAANRTLSVFLCGIALAAGGAQNFPGRCVNQRCSPGPNSLKTTPGASTNRATNTGLGNTVAKSAEPGGTCLTALGGGPKVEFCQSQKNPLHQTFPRKSKPTKRLAHWQDREILYIWIILKTSHFVWSTGLPGFLHGHKIKKSRDLFWDDESSEFTWPELSSKAL